MQSFKSYKLNEELAKDYVAAIKVDGVIYKALGHEFHADIMERLPKASIQKLDRMANPEDSFGFMNIHTRKFVPVNDIQVRSLFSPDKWVTMHSFHPTDDSDREVRVGSKLGDSNRSRWNIGAAARGEKRLIEDWSFQDGAVWVSAFMNKQKHVVTGPSHGQADHVTLIEKRWGKSPKMAEKLDQIINSGAWDVGQYSHKLNKFVSFGLNDAPGHWIESGEKVTPSKVTEYNVSNPMRPPGRAVNSANIKRLGGYIKEQDNTPYTQWGISKSDRVGWKRKAIETKKFWNDGSVSGFLFNNDLYIGKLSVPKKFEHAYLVKQIQKRFKLSDEDVDNTMDRADGAVAQFIYYNPKLKIAAALEDKALSDGHRPTQWREVVPVKFNKIIEV